MLFLTAAGSTQPDYVALGMVLVLALFVAVRSHPSSPAASF